MIPQGILRVPQGPIYTPQGTLRIPSGTRRRPLLTDPRRQVLMGGKMNGQLNALGSGLNVEMSRLWTRWGNFSPLFVQLVYLNAALDNTPGVGEIPNTVPVSVRASLQNNANSNIAAVTFGGAQTGIMYPNGILISDPFPFTNIGFTATSKNGAVWVNTEATVANDTQTVPTGWLKGGTGEINWRTTTALAANQIYTAGAWTTSGGGDTSLQTMSPFCMIGHWNSPSTLGRPASVLVGPGDSIQAGFNGNIYNGVTGTGGGAWQHSCRSLIQPFAMKAIASSAICDPILTPLTVSCYKWFDYVFAEDGHNNFSAGDSAATVAGFHQQHNLAAKAQGVLGYYLSNIIPDTTAPGNDYTQPQTPRPAFGLGEAADDYNLNYVAALAGTPGYWDSYIDTCNSVALSTNRRWWNGATYVSTTAPAGIHPNQAGQDQIETVVKPVVQALPVLGATY